MPLTMTGSFVTERSQAIASQVSAGIEQLGEVRGQPGLAAARGHRRVARREHVLDPEVRGQREAGS